MWGLMSCRVSRTVSDDIAVTLMIPRSALSPSSSAPSVRRGAAMELDRSARPRKSSGRAGFAVTTMEP
jgi:hypothetical protein